MTTKIQIDADTTYVNDTPKYRLYARCTEQGSLPDRHTFIVEIVDSDDPTGDILYRVASVADMEGDSGYVTNRDTAIASGFTYWRASQFTNYYNDAEVAANAKTVLQDEVNALVQDYETYSSDFAASSEVVTFPQQTTAAVQALKDAYDTALTAYNTALTTQTTADATVETAEEDLDDINDWLDRKDTLSSDLDDLTTGITEAKTRYSDFLGIAGSGVASNSAWIVEKIEEFLQAYDSEYPTGNPLLDTERDALEGDKNAFSAQRGTAKTVDVDQIITQSVTQHTDAEANINTYIPYTDADRDSAQSTLTSAQSAKVTADADVQAKYAALETAYDAVKAVCPDWTPDEPLPASPSS